MLLRLLRPSRFWELLSTLSPRPISHLTSRWPRAPLSSPPPTVGTVTSLHTPVVGHWGNRRQYGNSVGACLEDEMQGRQESVDGDDLVRVAREFFLRMNPGLKPTQGTGKAKPVPIVIRDQDVEEKHIRGWGNGGQKINKTSNCCQLTHIPTGVVIQCQDTRSLQANRKIARKRLRDRLDEIVNGRLSKAAKAIEKKRQRKHKQRQRAKKKYRQTSGGLVVETDAKDGSLQQQTTQTSDAT